MRLLPHGLRFEMIRQRLHAGLVLAAAQPQVLVGRGERRLGQPDFELRFVSDGMLRLLRCSREEITGRYGNNWKNIVHPDDFAFTVAHLDEQRKIQPEYRLSYRIQRADG